ncbi:hypothetical protein JRO89_XS01G0145700 [Xanthoceras sorbifolium]|uniref:RNase H type-1 domain-containing protein n=1 Tax=Xanthoceras sorbifolium TaxID=99658 RepID=A0ABQ8IJX8_9ROSI|nr:hypothetical protein JRO89_XS01G0145700 [Xanthoceras sorbifolium]
MRIPIRNLSGFILIVVVSFLLSACDAQQISKKTHVIINNLIGAGIDLKLHCQSKDDDLGEHVIPYQGAVSSSVAYFLQAILKSIYRLAHSTVLMALVVLTPHEQLARAGDCVMESLVLKKFSLACVKFIIGGYSPEITETLAVLFGLHVASAAGFNFVSLETDVDSMVKLVHGSSIPLSKIGF